MFPLKEDYLKDEDYITNEDNNKKWRCPYTIKRASNKFPTLTLFKDLSTFKCYIQLLTNLW